MLIALKAHKYINFAITKMIYKINLYYINFFAIKRHNHIINKFSNNKILRTRYKYDVFVVEKKTDFNIPNVCI